MKINLKLNQKKSKISSIAIILMLTFSLVVFALQTVNAQEIVLDMNSPDEAVINFPTNIDLNGPTSQLEGIKFAYRPPGGVGDFIITTEFPVDNEPGLPGERYVTDPNGDLDISVTFTEYGQYEIKWVLPALNIESDPEIITVDDPLTTTGFAFIQAMPSTVGVNQATLIHYGIHLPTNWPQTGWADLTVEVERPDGSSYTIDGLPTDLTGGAGVNITPDQIGTWRIRTIFPEQTSTSGTRGFPPGTLIRSDTSDWFDVIVTAEPAAEYVGHPPPTEYWSRPISSIMWSWADQTGNMYSNVRPTTEAPYLQPYTTFNLHGNADAPETGHVLWNKPGLVGGAFSPLGGGLSSVETGIHATEDGDAYEGLFDPPVVMNGVVYFNKFKSNGGNDIEQPVVAVDMRTGEVLWERLWGDRLEFGQSFFFTGFNYHGVFQYLVSTAGSTWVFYEPTTGREVFRYTNVPGGGSSERYWGPNGEIIIFTINLARGTLQKWSSQWVIEALRWRNAPNGPNSGFGSWIRGDMGDTIDARYGIEWVRDMPSRADLPSTTRTQNHQRLRFLGNNEATIVGSNFDRGSPSGAPVTMWAITFDPAIQQTGGWSDLVWVETSYSDDLGPTQGPQAGLVPQHGHDPNAQLAWVREWEPPMDFANLNIEDASMEDDVFTVAFNDQPQDWGFRLSTGEELWGPFKSHYQNNWSYESMNSWNTIVRGENIYLIGGHGGTVHALNAQTGASLWNYTFTDEFNTYLFNNAWRFRTDIIADGKIYFSHSEHSPFDPKPPHAPFVCLDLYTGEKLWESNNLRGTEWGGLAVMGDNIIVGYNTYDQQLIAFGKGPSETTVTIQDNVIALHDQVLVTGTVMDISAGTKDQRIMARFPKGVAAVSDESMTDHMEWIYMQKPRPLISTGVPVKIQIFDPNGDFAWIGTATTDQDGNYAYSFIPSMEGMYAVIAQFDTNNGYWGSKATAYLTVGPAAKDVIIPPYPGYQGPSAQTVANNVVNSLPANPTSAEISTAVVNALPEAPEPTTIPEYQTIDLILVILVAIAIVIGVVILVKKN
jgi:hypothetical protein